MIVRGMKSAGNEPSPSGRNTEGRAWGNRSDDVSSDTTGLFREYEDVVNYLEREKNRILEEMR